MFISIPHPVGGGLQGWVGVVPCSLTTATFSWPAPCLSLCAHCCPPCHLWHGPCLSFVIHLVIVSFTPCSPVICPSQCLSLWPLAPMILHVGCCLQWQVWVCKGNLMIEYNTQILSRGIQSILDKYNTAEGCIPCKGDPKRKL